VAPSFDKARCTASDTGPPDDRGMPVGPSARHIDVGSQGDVHANTSSDTKEKIMSDSSKGTAVVTGASRGIAPSMPIVSQSAAMTSSWWAATRHGSRRLRPPDAGDRTLGHSPAGRSHNKVDIANVEKTLRNDPSITILVNNAGTASIAPC